ncbi:MAG: hypothetical protein V9H26_12905 [Verrucomicrobiota bacterium]
MRSARPIPALEQGPDAPPEKLLLHFATADVTLLGSGLKAVEKAVQQLRVEIRAGGEPAFCRHIENPHCRRLRHFI